MHESTTYQAILDEGAVIGELRAMRRSILRLGEPRLGAPSAKVRKRLEAIADLSRLEEMLLRVQASADWDALLTDEPAAPPAPKPRARKGS